MEFSIPSLLAQLILLLLRRRRRRRNLSFVLMKD